MRRFSTQRGSAMLELALVFLIFFSFLYAIMEFGRIVSSYNILAGATREGARYAMVRGSDSGAPASTSDIAAVVKRWAIGLDHRAIDVNVSWNGGSGAGNTVRVRSRYEITPMTSFLFGDRLRLSSSSEMLISQ
ncbi:MAG: pilus assembly protein [Acidobacteria bacterium]|nr:pilus assembly protein [Acidobacteriota bacterium]